MSEEINKELNDAIAKFTGSGQTAAEMQGYAILGAAMTATRAFDKVSLKIDANTQRIFVAITLRWWAKYKKMEKLRQAWLGRAERRCRECLPEGWRLLVYYDRGSK
jgi:hypothetical protein